MNRSLAGLIRQSKVIMNTYEQRKVRKEHEEGIRRSA